MRGAEQYKTVSTSCDLPTIHVANDLDSCNKHCSNTLEHWMMHILRFISLRGCIAGILIVFEPCFPYSQLLTYALWETIFSCGEFFQELGPVPDIVWMYDIGGYLGCLNGAVVREIYCCTTPNSERRYFTDF